MATGALQPKKPPRCAGAVPCLARNVTAFSPEEKLESYKGSSILKDTGHYWYNCQRPVSSLGVSQHMNKNNKKPVEICKITMKEKNSVTRSCVLSDA